MTNHNHTPWPTYHKTMTTAGLNVKLINDVLDGLQSTWDCPECDRLAASEQHNHGGNDDVEPK